VDNDHAVDALKAAKFDLRAGPREVIHQMFPRNGWIYRQHQDGVEVPRSFHCGATRSSDGSVDQFHQEVAAYARS
jgi:hypothetical protein